MRIPVLHGVIDRRILVNYRVDPQVLSRHLPAPFRPLIVGGFAMAGICLIRLRGVRPVWWPAALGIRSENAAHRFAVHWGDGDDAGTGVYVRRRDSDSWLNALAGGMIFPGVHHRAKFDVAETAECFEVRMASVDGQTRIHVRGQTATALPASSVFSSLDEASQFYEAGSLGYSDTADPARFDGLELRCPGWQVEPLEIEVVHSSFFNDEYLFPRGSIKLDHALLMRGIEHTWHGREDLCCDGRQREKSFASSS